MSQTYNASSIEILEGLEPVQKRPGMYTDTTNPNHLLYELIDNSTDEALAGFATQIDVIFHQDDFMEVVDNGRGIPCDIHEKTNVSALELILTKLHSGAKFSNKDYSLSGGLHGVGISVVNALSKELEVRVKRDNKVFFQSFANGKKLADITTISYEFPYKTATSIKFKIQESYFEYSNFDLVALFENLQAKALLLNGLKINFINKKEDLNKSWYFKDGISNYLKEKINFSPDDFATPFELDFSFNEQEHLKSVCFFTNSKSICAKSYVNLIATSQGGIHVNSLKNGIFLALDEFMTRRNLHKKNIKLIADDIFLKTSFILSINLKNPEFLGQTKEKLINRNIATLLIKRIKDAFSLFLNSNIELATFLAQMSLTDAKKRIAQKELGQKKKYIASNLPSKLTDCRAKNMDAEIFIVEGDSAGGSAKQGRDKEFQAVLPLRGKILNTWEVDKENIFSSNEVKDLVNALGIDKNSSDLTNLRYGKICILADADSDGLHIATLICALFVKHFLFVVKAGFLYVALPPLYRVDFKKETYYCQDETKKNNLLKKLEQKFGNINQVNVQRFKGLGEMNPNQLKETTLNPKSRKLVKLTIEDCQKVENLMDMMLAKKRSIDRKNWLERNDLS